MADLPSGFWAGWIVVLTVGSFAVLVLLVWSTFFRDGPPHEDHVWDGDLREGDAAAPIWWFWLILVLMVFSVIYLLLYPGLGSFKGALKWSQSHHLAHSVEKYNDEFEPISEELLSRSPEALLADRSAINAAKAIFSNNCAVCHGEKGTGQVNRFPNLADKDWQWGGTNEAITTSISGGRKAAMPPWGEVLSAHEIEDLTAYIQRLSTGSPIAGGAAKNNYMTYCAACHQPDGKGNVALGAPNLTDDVWLYGNDTASISHTIAEGRNGEMPAQKERLTEVQIRLLASWLTAEMPEPATVGHRKPE